MTIALVIALIISLMVNAYLYIEGKEIDKAIEVEKERIDRLEKML